MGRTTRTTRSNGNVQGPIAPQESTFANHLAEGVLKDSDSSQGLHDLSSSDYSASLPHSDSDSSDDDAVDIPYRHVEDRTDVATKRTKPSEQKDPGPSVRVRTMAEVQAAINAQVEDRVDLVPSVPWAAAAAEHQQSKSKAAISTPSTGQKRTATVAQLNMESPTRVEGAVPGRRRSNGTPAAKVVNEEQPAKRRKSGSSLARTRESTTRATPKLKNGGLPFNSTWYNSPLEDPEVYRMKDKAYALGVYNDLVDIITRATEDHGRIKAALLKKGSCRSRMRSRMRRTCLRWSERT
ncbi:unnamed protein product [Penicillium glandicola]